MKILKLTVWKLVGELIKLFIMSRNIKASNQYITDCLNNYLNQYSQGDERLLEPLNKTIKLDKLDQVLLKKAKLLSKKNLFSQYKSACFLHDNEYYFIYVGAEKINYDQDFKDEYFIRLNEEEITPGWTVLIISDLEVKIKSSVEALEIYNILSVSNSDSDYYDIEDCQKIRTYFEDWYIYKIKSESILIPNPDISRVSLVYFLNYNSVNNLSFEEKTIHDFSILAYEGDPSLPFENILDSYMSFSWKYSFLDIYRCLEKLFIIPKTLKLYKDISVDLSFLEFITKFDLSIKWKPKEEEALASLFEVIEERFLTFSETHNEFNLVKNSVSTDYSKSTNEATVIYFLRNHIVHFRSTKIELKESDWNSIISFCLLFTHLIYEKYGEYLNIQQSFPNPLLPL